MRPRTFFLHIGAVCGVNAAVGWAFSSLGFPLIGWFCTVQCLVLLAAVMVYAVHAADGEHVVLTADSLRVRTDCGWQSHTACFHPCWTRLQVERRQGDRGGLWLCSGSQRLRVGRYLSPSQRRAWAEELSDCLRKISR